MLSTREILVNLKEGKMHEFTAVELLTKKISVKEQFCNLCNGKVNHISGSIFECENGHRFYDTIDGQDDRICANPLCDKIVVGDNFLCEECITLKDEDCVRVHILIFQLFKFMNKYNMIPTKQCKKEVKIFLKKETDNLMQKISNWIEHYRIEFINHERRYTLYNDEINELKKLDEIKNEKRIDYTKIKTQLSITIEVISKHEGFSIR